MSVITKRRLAVAVTLLLLFSSTIRRSVHADTESPRVVLGPGAKGLVVGPGMNAAGRDLRGCKFITQNLTGANFDGCNLYGVQIADCMLKHASFRGTIFTGAIVGVVPEDEADFTDAVINENGFKDGQFLHTRSGFLELSPQQLMSTWSYKNKDLHQCVITAYTRGSKGIPKFDFRGADLKSAVLKGSFTKSDFTNAHIYKTRFGTSSLTFEQLASTVDFKKGRLCVHFGYYGTGLIGKCDFSGIDLRGSSLSGMSPDTNFTDASINDCEFGRQLTKQQLYSTRSYKEGNLTRIEWNYTDLSGTDFSGMNLTDGVFFRCKLGSANLENTVITGARFFEDGRAAKSDRLTLEQIKSTWNYKHGRMADVHLPDDITKALKAESLKAEALKKEKAPTPQKTSKPKQEKKSTP